MIEMSAMKPRNSTIQHVTFLGVFPKPSRRTDKPRFFHWIGASVVPLSSLLANDPIINAATATSTSTISATSLAPSFEGPENVKKIWWSDQEPCSVRDERATVIPSWRHALRSVVIIFARRWKFLFQERMIVAITSSRHWNHLKNATTMSKSWYHAQIWNVRFRRWHRGREGFEFRWRGKSWKPSTVLQSWAPGRGLRPTSFGGKYRGTAFRHRFMELCCQRLLIHDVVAIVDCGLTSSLGADEEGRF